MSSKYYSVMQSTDSRRIYNLARRGYLASGRAKGIRCSFCPFHHGENLERQNFQKSWKRQSKRKHQYKQI